MENPEKPRGRWARFRQDSQKNYRLVVMNADTFDEVGAYNLSAMNVYVLASTIFLVLLLSVFALVAYTPLRTYVPGYGDTVQRQEMIDLENTVADLTEQLETQTEYVDNFRRILVGDATTFEDIERRRTDSVAPQDIEPVALSEAEIQLRREVASQRSGRDRPNADNTSLPTTAAVPLDQVALLAPVNGEISAGFRPEDGHLGVDILASRNTPIRAAAAGVVFMSEFTNANGNVIGIQHANDLVTFYKHNSELLKQVGDRVNGGEAVAIIGNTGTLTTGPHLHFEIWYRGRVVDPAEYLSF